MGPFAQFEAWLSYRTVTSEGLVSRSREAPARNAILVAHGAPSYLGKALKQEWSRCSLEQADEKLSRPDVMVTNMHDKREQIAKALNFIDTVKDTLTSEEFEEISTLNAKNVARADESTEAMSMEEAQAILVVAQARLQKAQEKAKEGVKEAEAKLEEAKAQADAAQEEAAMERQRSSKAEEALEDVREELGDLRGLRPLKPTTLTVAK